MFEKMAANLSAKNAAGQGRAIVDAMSGRGDRRAVALGLARQPFNSNVDPASDNVLEGPVVAAIILMLGEPQLALDYIESDSKHLGTTMDWVPMLPMMDPIRCDPRFRAMVERLKTRDPFYETVCRRQAG